MRTSKGDVTKENLIVAGGEISGRGSGKAGIVRGK
jgi:hypothetical protein